MDLMLIKSKETMNSIVCRYSHWLSLAPTIKIPNTMQYPLHWLPVAKPKWYPCSAAQELKELRSRTFQYWGGNENQVYHTMVYLEMISNDYPERCSNTGTTQNGTFTHRWRHSCMFEDSIVPSCPSCHFKNIEYILSPPSVHIKRESSCHQCLDW